MGEFFVVEAGLSGLGRQLARACDDAWDVLDYTHRQCGLDWRAEGLLLKLLGPHDHVYAGVTGALAGLQDRSGEAANQVALAMDDYLDADREAAARLGRAYQEGPGAGTPAFADVAEPGRHLTDPGTAGRSAMWSLNPLTDLVSPAAWLRQVSIALFGHDPFEWWARALSGDWAAYVHAGAALRRVGAGASDIGSNLLAGASDARAVWQGSAADAEHDFQVALAHGATALQPACDTYAGLYGRAADAAQDLLDVVGDLITDLIDALVMVNLSSAVGAALVETGVGAMAGFAVGAYYAEQAYRLYQEIARCYSTAQDTIEAVAATITTVRADLAVPELPSVRPYRFAGVSA